MNRRSPRGPFDRPALLVGFVVLLLVVPAGFARPPAWAPTPSPRPAPTHEPLLAPPTHSEGRGADAPIRGDAPAPNASLRPSLGPDAPTLVPYAWRGLSAPPGAEALDSLGSRATSVASPRGGTGWGNGGEWGDLAQYCYGIWPSSGGQAAYLPNCYGHDEPGIAGYSTLPGSGGNATWAVTLPVDAAVGAMQADLYSAIWFGLPLSDPFAWLDSCFLELQFYPDSSWTQTGVVLNNWIGAAVGWQIQSTNGYEDPCFYQTLQVNGTAGNYLNMHGGDRIVVRMTGWTGSRSGENLQVIDLSRGTNAPLTLFNSTGQIPLDPSYSAGSLPNGLQWTPGGELPVTFAFETGHTTAPFPNTNGYGGCSAGVPPPTPADPAVPCPSYDPASWIADSRSPWEISPPTFSNATASETASQVAFTQDLGGIAFIDPISNSTCVDRDGSAHCSYPWYSYSCTSHAFEFGATDWPNTTADFGKFGQYQQGSVLDRSGLGYYPPTNVSLPACGQSSDTVIVGVGAGASSGASVHFLNSTILGNLTVPGLLPGEYSLSAMAPAGRHFLDWAATGSVQVSAPLSPWATVVVRGNGTVRALFSTGPASLTAVRFDDSDPNASVQVVPGFSGSSAARLPNATTVPAGGTLQLEPGIYSINALPSPGSNFTSWTVVSGLADLSAPLLPFTWLTVTGQGSSVDLRMSSAASTAKAIVVVYPIAEDGAANGSILIHGARYWTFTNNSTVNGYAVVVPVGSYAISETTSPGTSFLGWALGIPGISLDAGNSSTIVLENGTAYLEGIFTQIANVTLADAGAPGAISLDASGFQANASLDAFQATPTGPIPLAADPPANESFSGWSGSPGTNFTITHPANAATSVNVKGSGTITAQYTGAPALGLSFRIVAAGSGTIRLDGVPESNGSAAPYLAAGLYVAQFLPGPDQFFKSWSGSGGITLLNATPLGWPLGTELVNLTGAGAVLTAHAARGTPPVTFLLSTPPGTTPTFRVNGTTVAHNGTIDVGAGSIPVSIQGSLPPGMGVRSWTAVGGVQVEGANGTQATIFVNGSGTVMPLLGPVLSVLASATPANASSVGSSEWAPLTVDFAAIASNGTGPYLYQWTYGDGQTGVGASGTHRFPLPGVYGWQVGVTDHGGNLTSASGTLVVTGAPWAVALNLTPSVGEAPFNVSVSLNTTGPSGNSTFQWAVPLLGLTTPGPSGRFQVTGPGVYQVVAQAHNFQGFLSQALAVVTAEPNVFLIVSATPGTGTVPLIVHFDAAAINATGTTVYNWSFGDGAYASAPIVQHQYERNGTFEANVSVVDGLGGAAEKSVVVRVVPPPPPLRVQMQLDPANLVLGNTTRIGTNTTGGVPSYVVVYPTKDLPPGCIPLPRPPNASFFCTPVAAGNFLVQVSVMDSDGHEANASGWLNVTGPPAAKMPVRSTTTNPPLYTPAELYGAIAAALAVAAVLGVLLRRRTPPPKEPEDLPSDLELADGSVLPSGPDSWGMSGPDDTSEFDPGPPPR